MEHIQRLEGNVQLAQMRHDAINSEVTAAVLEQAKEALEAAKAEAEKPAEEAAESVKEPVAEPKKETKAPVKKQPEPEKPEGKGEVDADHKAEGASADEKQAEEADYASAANAEEDAKKNETEQ